MSRNARIVILVNGSVGSAAAERARELLRRSEIARVAEITLLTRDGDRLAATCRFASKLWKHRPALVYVVDMAISGVVAGILYRSMSLRSRLVIDSGDAIYALAKKTGRNAAARLVTGLLERSGQWWADRLVVRGTGHLQLLGRHASKAVVIQDGVSIAEYRNVPPINAHGAFDNTDPLVVGVVGSLQWNPVLGWCYGLELIQALLHIPEHAPVRGLIVGDGSGLAHLKSLVEQSGLSRRVNFLDRVPPRELPDVLARVHVALSTQTDDAVGRVRTTGKLPLYLAAGRYVLASRVGEAARLLPDSMLVPYHGSYDPDYPERLAAIIRHLAENRNALAAARDGPRLSAPLDYDRLTCRFDDLLLPLLPSVAASMRSSSRPVLYLALGVHRRGGMERAAFETINRLARNRPITVIARENECVNVRHIPVSVPRRPAMVEVTWYRFRARHAARKFNGYITTGIGASGGPVDVVVAQYCQEAFRRRIGTVRARGRLQTWWHLRNMARFCAEERAVYQSRQLKRVIAVSRGVGRELIECYGVDPSIIRYVPNGVDLATFRTLPGRGEAKAKLRGELGLPGDGMLACFVGGDWRRKGLRPAIEALRDSTGVRLVVVGAGDQAEFGAIAAAADVADRVHFVGKRPDPQRYLQAADVYLFPSLYEAFSLSCIEAAACGLPLVVTKINGSEELVEENVNGFFVDHDATSIAVRLRELRDDANLRERMAARSTQIGQRYDWETIAAAHEAVYAELDSLASRKPST